MSKKHWTGSHTKHRLLYHIVWIPKRRKKILIGKIANRVKNLFYESCKHNKWWIHELKVLEDHVHVLIQIKPRESVSSVVKRLKGVSSKILREEYPELIEFRWGKSFWCEGFIAESVGKVTESRIQSYIRDQEVTKSMPH